ncbi:MAG: hypothetical protein WA705_24300 [Candidatus Ozemobacteraceae bacterium]
MLKSTVVRFVPVCLVIGMLSCGGTHPAFGEEKSSDKSKPVTKENISEKQVPLLASASPIVRVASGTPVPPVVIESAKKAFIHLMETRNRDVEYAKKADQGKLKGPSSLLRTITASNEFCAMMLERILLKAEIPTIGLTASYTPPVPADAKSNLENESKILLEQLKLHFPEFIKAARGAKDPAAERYFQLSTKVLESQSKIILEAISGFEKMKSIECINFVCKECGFIVKEKTGKACPLCNADEKSVQKFY